MKRAKWRCATCRVAFSPLDRKPRLGVEGYSPAEPGGADSAGAPLSTFGTDSYSVPNSASNTFIRLVAQAIKSSLISVEMEIPSVLIFVRRLPRVMPRIRAAFN